jgi:hypothetical protein
LETKKNRPGQQPRLGSECLMTPARASPDLYRTRRSTTRKSTVTTREKLASLVNKLIAEEPCEKFGFAWAARHQSYYAEALGVSDRTVRSLITKPPFVSKEALVGEGPIKINGSKQVSGPRKLCLVRIGEAPPKDVADEAKRVMITIWNKQMAKQVTYHEGRCLWGMTGDIMKLLVDVGLPADLGGELAIAVFKHALADWPNVASAAKLAAEARPGYKPRYYEFPCITHLRSFWKAAVHAYVSHLQFDKVKPPTGLEFLAPPTGAGAGLDHPIWKIQDITYPMIDHPGLTPEIGKAIDAGHAAAEKKFLKFGG